MGEMRAATLAGSSCTLSGISQLCSSVLNVGIVAPDVQGGAAQETSGRCALTFWCSGRGGRFSQNDTGLLHAHSNRIGNAMGSA